MADNTGNAQQVLWASIGSMVVATTTDRVIIYIGTSGGMMSGGAVEAQSQASDATLVSAGVHRYLMRQLN
jgi:hypothetical protein